jgi:hypothetical protein
VRAKITPTPQLDLTAAFTTSRHVGELPRETADAEARVFSANLNLVSGLA